MKAFDYAAPASVEDAVKLLGVPHSAALSGGTDLLCRMKEYVSQPDRVVYLKEVKALAGISGSDGLTIGAGTLLADVLAHKGLREALPLALAGDAGSGHPADPQHGDRRRQTCSSGPGAGTTAPATASWRSRTARAWSAPATTATTPSS